MAEIKANPVANLPNQKTKNTIHINYINEEVQAIITETINKRLKGLFLKCETIMKIAEYIRMSGLKSAK